MSKKNTNLHSAKNAKNDEFYTQLYDIQQELYCYRHHFKDKIIFCNCDDPRNSNFWKHFQMNFKILGIKKLISTHFEKGKPSYKLEYDGTNITQTPLSENGDFRSPECIALLKESDIVVTNPPFSLFREYVDQLMEYNKKFVIIGNMNAITYKEIFKLIKENKLWLGNEPYKGKFEVPTEDYTPNVQKDKNGKFFVKMGNIRWFTNLDLPKSKRHQSMVLTSKYSPALYPKYDNYDAINVDKTKEIPKDYDGIMGVPISFLEKYNPAQFEIIDINPHFFEMVARGEPKLKQLKITGQKDPYARILIKKK